MSRPKRVGLTAHVARSGAHMRQRHAERVGLSNGNGNGHVDDEALARAWHEVQLHWLVACPGYRELLRERVSEAARKAELLSTRIDRSRTPRLTTSARAIEGCG